MKLYRRSRSAPVTNWVILINMLVFLYTTLRDGMSDNDILLRYGASYTPYIFENHEYWKLLTAAFLHFGIRHLGNNMLVLFVTGDNLEHTLGHMKHLISYLFSAIGASATSLVVEVAMGQKVLSADVSDTVFAVFGGLIWVPTRDNDRLGEFCIRNLLFSSGMMLLSGFFTEGINNVAHTGGLLVGFLLVVMLYQRPVVTLFSTDMI